MGKSVSSLERKLKYSMHTQKHTNTHTNSLTHILLHVVANKIIIIVIIIKKQTDKKDTKYTKFSHGKQEWLCINIDEAVQQCSNLDVQSC